MDCDPDSNPDSGPGARVNTPIDSYLKATLSQEAKPGTEILDLALRSRGTEVSGAPNLLIKHYKINNYPFALQ